MSNYINQFSFAQNKKMDIIKTEKENIFPPILLIYQFNVKIHKDHVNIKNMT